MKWDDLHFQEQQQPQPLKPRASVNVSYRRGNSIASVTEVDATADHGLGMYTLDFPFLRAHEVVELLNVWETLMKKRR